MIFVRFTAVCAVLTLAACVVQPPNTAPDAGAVLPPPVATQQGGVVSGGSVIPGQPTGQPTPVPDARPPLNPNLPRNIESSGAAAPVISLVKSARAALKAGRTDQAGASLERALRIEPRNPWVWQSLSALHLVTRQAEQAESEARKSNSLGKRNPYLEVENWRLLAEARRLRGDAAGAAAAQARHEDLQSLIAP